MQSFNIAGGHELDCGLPAILVNHNMPTQEWTTNSAVEIFLHDYTCVRYTHVVFGAVGTELRRELY